MVKQRRRVLGAAAGLGLALPALIAAAPSPIQQRELSNDLQDTDRVEVRYSGARMKDDPVYRSCAPDRTGLVFQTSDTRELQEIRAALDLGWHRNPGAGQCCGSLMQPNRREKDPSYRVFC